MGRRVVLLIVAVLIAAIGTSMVFFYVRSADDRAIADQQPVSVLVAKVPLTAGTRVGDAAAQGAFELRELPAAAVTPGALSAVEPVKDFVALAPIFPGQQLLTPMFGATAAATSALAVPPGQIAVSFQFTDPQRVAGFVRPGSEVVIFLTVPSAQAGAPPGTRVLLPRATVIATGPTTVTPPPKDTKQANAESVPNALLTLALSQVDAERLIFASQNGSLYLGLLNGQSQVAPGPGVTAENLFA